VTKIKVNNSGLIKLQSFNDFPDGNLEIGEAEKNVPIKIKRFYIINHLFNDKSVRGKHAHKKLEQYIFCLNGHFVLELDDGKTKQKILMNKSNIGVKLGPLLWHTMKKFSQDCVMLVVANDYYKKSDYLRDYGEFLQYLKTHKIKK
jgi:dTDP-4-dehydrorhamnose 3,5-epimerase-like enzyme